MNILLVPIFTGFLLIAFLFALSLFIVVGAKYVYYWLCQAFGKQTAVCQKQPPSTPKAPPKKRKPIRSIEINPDEVDRIYVKKIS